jgi:transitional endoplasmic reticulum ATPase
VSNDPAGAQPAQRSVPPTRYSDVLGQNAAVEAARDLIELPLKHADLFIRIGAKPSGHGIILAGPPGTGKTLLARAVAGECGAHIEIVNGPALLSKWVGETEAAIRDVFERAQKFAPAVILFDEIDSIAPSRSAESAQHQVSTVAQLLVLLDGIEERGQIFVLATTNRPEHVDPALRRPGRFDQVVWMRLPDERGRTDIFEHYLRPLKLDLQLTPDRLAAELASAAQGLTGADIAYLCQRAAMFCVKDAVGAGEANGGITISRRHFDAALGLLTSAHRVDATPELPRLLLAG